MHHFCFYHLQGKFFQFHSFHQFARGWSFTQAYPTIITNEKLMGAWGNVKLLLHQHTCEVIAIIQIHKSNNFMNQTRTCTNFNVPFCTKLPFHFAYSCKIYMIVGCHLLFNPKTKIQPNTLIAKIALLVLEPQRATMGVLKITFPLTNLNTRM